MCILIDEPKMRWKRVRTIGKDHRSERQRCRTGKFGGSRWLGAITNIWYSWVMSKNTSVALSDNHLQFIHQQVQLGRYGSASEVIRDSLRQMEERELKIAALRRELQRGLDSGPARPFDWDAFMERRFGSSADG